MEDAAFPRKIEVRPTDEWHGPLNELCADLGTTENGLSGAVAARRLAEHGPNVLEEPKRQWILVGLARRFSNPLVLILLFAAGVAALMHEHASFAIIAAIVVMSILLDFVQEHRAEAAAEALRKRVALRVTVLRDGAANELPAADIVPDDVVLLAAGDLVPADCRLIRSRDLFVNEALLTGEPYPAEKHADGLGEADAATPDNGVFMGSSVVSGTGRALVVATGRATRIGAISGALRKERRRPPSPSASAASACCWCGSPCCSYCSCS